MGGTKSHMLDLAKYLRSFLELERSTGEPSDISADGNRYAVFKV